eukprot:CAMPEP_0172317976 /NCGR_PEP_ID=MMETSP1058-20130122/33479_1 /TAXON_ID=83371 /ORGANISM="Detonula confervacea, Strain CCMP 353" /LENGTH=511 /DNA_ID=CAMNT_0013032679 /DNA_START=40 /DNA_END=1576 /DNA_ORIENTATION=-
MDNMKEANNARKRKVDANSLEGVVHNPSKASTSNAQTVAADGSEGNLANVVTIEKARFDQLVADNKRLTDDVAALTSTVQELEKKLGIKQEGSTKHAVSLLEDLPDSLLTSISQYLSRTTRALLAVALTAHSSSWEKFGWKISPSKASKVVLANPYFGTREESDGYHCTSKYFRFQPPRKYNENWDYLDFIDVEEHVRKSLTDVDIGALLTCIDGINRLKKLRLPELVKIHGHGLSPLRGSTVLQFLDASLSCGTKRPSKPLLSEESVVSILSSIANPLGSSLRGLHLPHCWGKAMKNGFGRSKFLGPFLQIYGYNSRPCFPGSLKSGCTKCERDLTLSLGFRDRLNISFDSDNTASGDVHHVQQIIATVARDHFTLGYRLNRAVFAIRSGVKSVHIFMNAKVASDICARIAVKVYIVKGTSATESLIRLIAQTVQREKTPIRRRALAAITRIALIVKRGNILPLREIIVQNATMSDFRSLNLLTSIHKVALSLLVDTSSQAKFPSIVCQQ